MIAQAFMLTATLMLALMFGLMQACPFLIPYRRLLLEQYGPTIAFWATVLFVNVFAGVYTVGRTLFLKDTGHKLAHLEKQIRAGHSVAEDLTDRLRE